MPSRRTATPSNRPAPAPAELRTTILDTAEALLQAEGLAALSLREVARRAGVTHQAPYHHFADRESILAELVRRGFDELARRLAAATDRADPQDPRGLRIASGEAYVGFALDRPGVFGVMFRPEVCDAARFPQVRAAGERSHGELVRMVERLHAPDALTALRASGYWAQVHGLATLLIDGPLGQTLTDRASRMAHARAVLALMADGGLSGADPSAWPAGPR